MDCKDVVESNNYNDAKEHSMSQEAASTINNYTELEDHVMSNFQKLNLPNVNVPEKIIICLDVCYDDPNSMYRLGDGSTYIPIDMLKRVLDFFIHSKSAINKRTEFALLILKDDDSHFVQDFTNHTKDIINAIDIVKSEESTKDNFDLQGIFETIAEKIVIPAYNEAKCLEPPPYVVRMLMVYARSNCLPTINVKDPYFELLRKNPYLYIDILFAHEENCALYKCEEVYDALQDLDNGYSYVFEVSRNATKIHDCVAKLLAHPLQRPLQKNTDYSFPFKY
ncbi:BRISC and BRCA1-A complex member 1-like [Aricia agestis]|uniref:BRISC and BRCA1-A complex member 1-like n=1 Tax=Aricia agestis TaxID=91739 RepID=UPI001C20720C|nr:BRISC and BRCA1-A complex member 1-like [Aricia agestis]